VVIFAPVWFQAGELWKQLMPAGGAGAAEDQDTVLDKAKVRQALPLFAFSLMRKDMICLAYPDKQLLRLSSHTISGIILINPCFRCNAPTDLPDVVSVLSGRCM